MDKAGGRGVGGLCGMHRLGIRRGLLRLGGTPKQAKSEPGQRPTLHACLGSPRSQ